MGISTSNTNWGKYYRRISNREKLQIAFDGLDDSGKTTLIYLLKEDRIIPCTLYGPHDPVTFYYNNICIVCVDTGAPHVRRLKKEYYTQVDACVWVVDSRVHERLDEVREKMFQTLDDDRLRHLSVLILANKQDLPDAFNKEKITEVLQLNKLRQRWNVVESSMVKRQGYEEGFAWLVEELTKDTPTLWSLVRDTVTRMAYWRRRDAKPIAE